MPAIVANASNFLLDSDFPTDKLVALGTIDFDVPAHTNTIGQTPHGFSFTPLMWGSWSLTSNYAILYGLNTGPLSTSVAAIPFDSVFKVRADGTNIIFEGDNFTGSTIHVYARIFGFEPTTANDDLSGTTPIGDNFQFNTDYNYLKLYKSGYIDQAAGTGTPSTQFIAHDLGTNVQTLTWKEDGGVVTPLTYADGGDVQAEDVVTSIGTTALQIDFGGFQPATRVHYRMYVDV